MAPPTPVFRGLPAPPFETVADAVIAQLRNHDWMGEFGWRPKTIRHFRGSYALEEETERGTTPLLINNMMMTMDQSTTLDDTLDIIESHAIIVRIDDDTPFEGDVGDGYGVPGELRMDLALTLMIDGDLPPEDRGRDKTGFSELGAIAVTVMRILKAAVAADGSGPMWAVVQHVQDAGRGPDPDSTGDQARLLQNIVVGYRVLEENPTVLLSRGENA